MPAVISKKGMENLWNNKNNFFLDNLNAIMFASEPIINPLPPMFTPYAIIL